MLNVWLSLKFDLSWICLCRSFLTSDFFATCCAWHDIPHPVSRLLFFHISRLLFFHISRLLFCKWHWNCFTSAGNSLLGMLEPCEGNARSPQYMYFPYAKNPQYSIASILPCNSSVAVQHLRWPVFFAQHFNIFMIVITQRFVPLDAVYKYMTPSIWDNSAKCLVNFCFG